MVNGFFSAASLCQMKLLKSGSLVKGNFEMILNNLLKKILPEPRKAQIAGTQIHSTPITQLRLGSQLLFKEGKIIPANDNKTRFSEDFFTLEELILDAQAQGVTIVPQKFFNYERWIPAYAVAVVNKTPFFADDPYTLIVPIELNDKTSLELRCNCDLSILQVQEILRVNGIELVFTI
jgi:hypothetical protein